MRWPDPFGPVREPADAAGESHPPLGRPPATGAWRDGDPPADRLFAFLGEFTCEHGGVLPSLRVAYETWGELNDERDNAILICHALTGDAHVDGQVMPGQATTGWWPDMIGPGRPIDTDRFFVVASNVVGGCQGSSGPASLDARGREFGSRFPLVTIRDQVRAQAMLADALGIDRFHTVIGGSMGGMHALEWGASFPERVGALIVLAAPALTSGRTIAENTLQIDAIKLDPGFRGGDYYDAPAGDGPWRGLALARRLAMLNYRSHDELDERFGRGWQSSLSPGTGDGRYTIESYLDFHGNRFTRRFDANSYITLLRAMNSHDLGRGRGGVEQTLAGIECPVTVAGITSDELFPIREQHRIAQHVPKSLTGPMAAEIISPYGHDGFLVETQQVQRIVSAALAQSA